jgi:hypothetical protein
MRRSGLVACTLRAPFMAGTPPQSIQADEFGPTVIPG